MAAPRFRPKDIGSRRNPRGTPYRTTIPDAPGAGITAGSGTIYKSSIVREGNVIVTRILLDITGLASTTTDLDIIGTAGVCHLGQITTAINGVILGGTMTCLEVPATGADDIDLYSATVGTGAYDAIVTGLVETAMVTSGGAWTIGLTVGIVADSIPADSYIYLCNGEAGTVGTYTAGRFLITLFGNPA